MVGMASRRGFLTGLVCLSVAPSVAAAEDEVIQLDWPDLLPKDAPPSPPAFGGLIDHDQPAMSVQQPPSSGLRADWNGKIVRLPGFVVPLDHKGSGVVAFLLVPFVGACVHVPPPPANQLVLVTSAVPYEAKGMFDPVFVTGMFGAASTNTQLAQVGYALSADKIEPYHE